MVQSYNLNGRQFTTHDRDNDAWSSGNCAVRDQVIKVPGGTGAVPILTSMASTSVELATAKVSGGKPSTQL